MMPSPLPAARPSRALAIAALITGGLAFLTGWLPVVGFILGLAAIALGIRRPRQASTKGLRNRWHRARRGRPGDERDRVHHHEQ